MNFSALSRVVLRFFRTYPGAAMFVLELIADMIELKKKQDIVFKDSK